MIWNDFTHALTSLGHLGFFELVQRSDLALCGAIEGAIALKDETYYAFEGCGDRIILRMKGTQVSVMNGAGHYGVQSFIGLGSLSHAAVQLKDEAVNGVKAFGREHWNDARHLAIDVQASLGQAKDCLLDPALSLATRLTPGHSKWVKAREPLWWVLPKKAIINLNPMAYG